MELKMPEISETTEAAVITLWHVAEGAHVAKDQDILEVTTDKATLDIASPYDGVLIKISKKAGEKVEKGDVIAEIQERGR